MRLPLLNSERSGSMTSGSARLSTWASRPSQIGASPVLFLMLNGSKALFGQQVQANLLNFPWGSWLVPDTTVQTTGRSLRAADAFASHLCDGLPCYRRYPLRIVPETKGRRTWRQ